MEELLPGTVGYRDGELILDTSGKQLKLVGIIKDITERRGTDRRP
jgi:hypothetical protein